MNTKHEIIIGSETGASDALLAVLGATYSPEKVKQATVQGAKIRIMITTPWPRPKKLKSEVIVAPTLLEELQRLKGNADALELKISKLKGPQLLKIGEILGIPMPKRGRTESLRERLFGSLRSESIWNAIAGRNSTRSVSTDNHASTMRLNES
ncbi:MAG: hypothetical protein LV480_08970 [Methylacidiphilales bacterium]|nr:hypothetical protein [Candidatus Methylacidiphilales bacterium]